MVSWWTVCSLTPMLRITHKLTAISNPTPLLLKARNSSKMMPAYPNPNNNAMARSCTTRQNQTNSSLCYIHLCNLHKKDSALISYGRRLIPGLQPPMIGWLPLLQFQQLQKLQELLKSRSLAGKWLQILVSLFHQLSTKDHTVQMMVGPDPC